MNRYPDNCILADDYAPGRTDGAEVIFADDGTPWVYRPYPEEVITFDITHPALSAAEEQTLRDFYTSNRYDMIEFQDPRSGLIYNVLMQGPPFIRSMATPTLANIGMTLVGRLAP